MPATQLEMVQKDAKSFVFCKARVSEIVERETGKALMAQAKKDAHRHAGQAKHAHTSVVDRGPIPNAQQLEALRAISKSRNTAQRVGIALGICTRDASNVLRAMRLRKWIKVESYVSVGGSGRRAVYVLTNKGRAWLRERA